MKNTQSTFKHIQRCLTIGDVLSLLLNETYLTLKIFHTDLSSHLESNHLPNIFVKCSIIIVWNPFFLYFYFF